MKVKKTPINTKKEFKPFKLEIEIEDRDELLSLYHKIAFHYEYFSSAVGYRSDFPFPEDWSSMNNLYIDLLNELEELYGEEE